MLCLQYPGFFLSFNFYFGHKTPGGLKTWEN
jgi:hypothetical protein